MNKSGRFLLFISILFVFIGMTMGFIFDFIQKGKNKISTCSTSEKEALKF